MKLAEGADIADAGVDRNRVQEGRRSAVAEQMKSERMKVELIANVSRDLKTPLTSVVSYAALLGEDEIAQGKVTVKDLSTGVQETLPPAEAAALVRSALAARAGGAPIREP